MPVYGALHVATGVETMVHRGLCVCGAAAGETGVCQRSKYQLWDEGLWVREVREQGQLERLGCMCVLWVCISVYVMTRQARLGGRGEMRPSVQVGY